MIGRALEAVRGRGKCQWCDPLGYGNLGALPRDCACERECGAARCGRRPAIDDDIHRDGTPVAPGIDDEVDQMIRDFKRWERP